MSVGISIGTAALIGGAVAAGGSIAASKIQSNATKDASATQQTEANQALDFQKQQYADQQANQAPYLTAGKTALEQLSSLTGPNGLTAYGKTFDPGTFNGGPAFKAPTGADFMNDPGYQFRLAEGQKALERSAAAKGTATGGAALKAATRYGQDYASNEYGNVYNRALQGFQTNFGDALSAYQTNANTGADAFKTNYNVFSQDQGNQFNRLAAIAGLGQTATGQIGQTGTATAGNIGSIYSNLGNNLANLQTQGGNAAASGVVGAVNGLQSGLGAYQNYQLLQQILKAQAPPSPNNGSGYNA